MTSFLTAKLVGEGYERPDGEKALPIDVNYAKLPEWLVDRKQVPPDWNRKLQAIQAKAAEAVRALPPGFLGQFEGGEDAPVDYFLARQVAARLAETAEKGLLGGLKGAAGDWDKVVRAYEYNLIYVAEAAQTLARNADYELPFFKKQAAKHQQQLADLERRKGEAAKSAAAAAAEFQQECAAMGVDSADIRGSLVGLTAELPALAGAAVEAVRSEGVTEGIAYYASVVQAAGGGGGGGELLPTLAEVREGRTQAPAAPAAEPTAADGSSGGLEVDWDLGAALNAVGGGEAEGEEAPAAGISWELEAADLAGGDDVDASAPAGISWEVEAEPAADGGDAGAGDGDGDGDGAPAGPADVSWDIDISAAGQVAEQREAAAPAAAQQQQGGEPPRGAAAAAAAAEAEPAVVTRLVEDGAYRAALLDDLHELRAFLKQRQRELSGRGSELLLAGADAGRHVSADLVAAMLADVEAALAAFGGDRLKQLTALRTSGRYLDRLVAGLQRKAAQEAKFLRAADEAEARRGEVQRQLMADAAKQAALIKRTRAAKQAAEQALAAKLGRRINIQGEINQLL